MSGFLKITSANQTRENDVIITVDPILGNDAYDGRTDPVATLARASQLIPLDGLRNKIILSAGDHKRIEPAALTDVERLTFGSLGSPLIIEGTTSVAETFTVLSSTTTTITKDSSTADWIVDEHKGRMVQWNPLFGFKGFVVSNTVDTLTLTRVAGSPSGSLDIEQQDTRIISPDNNGDWAISRMYIWGNITLKNITFDGGYCPLTVLHAGNVTAINCAFKNHTDGFVAHGELSVLFSWFENCTNTGIVHSNGGSFISNPAFINCGTGHRASFGSNTTFAANSRVFAEDTTYLYEGKTDSVLNDETIGVYLDNVGTYAYIYRRGTYIKVNSSIIALNEDANTNVFRLDGGGHLIQFLNSNNITLDCATPADFFDIDGYATSLANYISGGQDLDAGKGTFIYG